MSSSKSKPFLLVLGCNPSRAEPRKNSTLSRLDRWMKELGIEEFAFANVISIYVDKPTFDAVQTLRLLDISRNVPRCITLGNFADSVATKLGIEHYALPHPSPRNRKFNNPNYEKQMLQKLVKSQYLKPYI